MKIKTEELTGRALDYAVGVAEEGKATRTLWRLLETGNWSPSTDWGQAGPIIEREGLASWQSTTPDKGRWCSADSRWMDLDPESQEFMNMPDPWHGPAMLIAAMRCFAASKLGEEIDVPDELL